MAKLFTHRCSDLVLLSTYYFCCCVRGILDICGVNTLFDHKGVV